MCREQRQIHSIPWSRSFTKMLNRTGINTEPWETPPVAVFNLFHQHSFSLAIHPGSYSSMSMLIQVMSSQNVQKNAVGNGFRGFTKVCVANIPSLPLLEDFLHSPLPGKLLCLFNFLYFIMPTLYIPPTYKWTVLEGPSVWSQLEHCGSTSHERLNYQNQMVVCSSFYFLNMLLVFGEAKIEIKTM